MTELMRIATIRDGATERPALIDAKRGVVLVSDLLPDYIGDAMSLLEGETYEYLCRLSMVASDAVFRAPESVQYAPPYRRPRKIWGIGLNYREHAGDLNEVPPTEPASFIKGDHTIIGQGETIYLPPQSARVTAEAELGLVIGRTCRNVSKENALDYVWGVCLILDQTAEDILQRNPRFLTRSKNFSTFFSFGPTLIPLAEVLEKFPTLNDIVVTTVINGREHRSNSVANMTFDPEYLVSFHSEVMPLFAGDIISTGTPGAVVIQDGDIAECRIPGLGTLSNPVRTQLADPA